MSGEFISDEQMQKIEERRLKARQEIVDICDNKKQWQMHIPVQQNDSDVVLENALQDELSVMKAYKRLKDDYFKTLDILDKYGVWTGFDEVVSDRVEALCSNPDYFLGNQKKSEGATE